MTWRKLPLGAEHWQPLARNPLPYAGLVTSLAHEHSYPCEIQGALPDLEGTLYRVGPGRYDRGPDRKRMVLDGDGMVQGLTLSGGRATYRNRYVRTAKLLAEEAADRFLYPTFSTHGSGPLALNLGLSLANQANTTVIEWAGRVWAFDESHVPYELSREDLATLGEHAPDPAHPKRRYWAHWKLDASHGQLHLLAIDQGRVPTAHITSYGLDGRVAGRLRVALPRAVYFHDWFVTQHHFAFLLHPAFISFSKLFQVLIARETFSEALAWRPERGGLLFLVDRRDGATRGFAVSSCWMWHAINGHETDGRLVLEFIGSSLGGGLGTDASPLFRLMRGEPVQMPPEPVNLIRRYTIDLSRGTLAETVLDARANYELPSVSATERGRRHTRAYMTEAAPGELFPRGLCQFDAATGVCTTYRFGPDEFCSEPVFLDALTGDRGSYLMTQVYAAAQRVSYFALFEEARFAAGPIARILLRHHVPLSFHGYWAPARTGREADGGRGPSAP
jgi:all-trans-8'-apo-beta-carotenal 15,15'-oxygenase